jgi:tetratricopeptide (TPR) repeat protein
MITLAGLLYIALFEALFYLRQQGISLQFTLEALLATAVGTAIAFTIYPVNLAIFLAVLYLVTMRGRLLIDLANWFTRRRNYSKACAIFEAALRLFPDPVIQCSVLVNRGNTELAMLQAEAANRTLKEALSGVKLKRGALYQAAGYYNLGIACRRTGRHKEAAKCFLDAKSAMPNSIYAYAAERALKEDGSGKK